MKTLLTILMILFVTVTTEAKPEGKIIATVDFQFSYGFDVTWVRNPKLLKRAELISVEVEGIQHFIWVKDFKVGWSGQVGIIYVYYVPFGLTVPPGSIVRIIK